MGNLVAKRVDLSLNRKIWIILSFIITIITLWYFVQYNITSKSTINYLVSSLQSPSRPKECKLSMKESDDWFCESDKDWKRRKLLHHIQDKRNRVSTSRSLFFQNNWEPTIQCEFERRLGNTGDGGKWVCDVHRFHEQDNKSFLVYSLGSSGDFSFERAIKTEFPKAEIHTFDMGLYRCPDNLCVFHQVRLGNGKNDSSKTLQMIMNDLGHRHRQIHILKIDIEGSEFNFFEELFGDATNHQHPLPYIRQILFEIHLGSDRTEGPCIRTHKLFELFRANNYAIFHKECNLYDPQNVFEYAMLRLNKAFFISN